MEKKLSRSERVAKSIRDAVALFEVKNSGYGEAYVHATDIMDILVPDKSLIRSRFQQLVYHNMYAIVTKLLRACSIIFYSGSERAEDLEDSWRDIGVYAFMIGELCTDKENLNGIRR